MSTQLLPLFPLQVVLFPGMSLPLHIFEPRYKQMIRHCLEQKQEFGVVLAREEGVAGVGCSADILKVVKQYEDGRMDILTVGQSRFRLLQVFEDLPYFQGKVELLPDEEEPPGEPASPDRLLESYREVFPLLHGRQSAAPDVPGGFPLAFHIATVLPLDLEYKQQLLELRSEAERQQSLAEHLEALAPQLRRLERFKEKAGGNGHAR